MTLGAGAQAAGAGTVWNYLAENDITIGPLSAESGAAKSRVLRDDAAECAIGLGSFDLRVARHCAALYLQGHARFLVFTGGFGSGSADLKQPEAVAYKNEAVTCGVPEEDILVEAESTNTPQNWSFTLRMLKEMQRPLEGKRIILSTTPYRQRRVRLTCAHSCPAGATLINAPPPSTYEEDVALFEAKGLDLPGLLGGEVQRLDVYGRKGDILREDIPSDIRAGAAALGATFAA
eukprot:CAMPEP_0198562554 /NCGR_PEP_ID=MMETSP1462-20131121/97353_1 /TAXON_ID=1333877 /ORGANISM="Brandtodinium nutriculum, Strain RCC3387" /LENGTH=233 /DNA_ID=CAMNT_0044293487 /DNA_START=32 /DNA_END=733 /DNA_ORIENTATION=+